MMNVTKMHLDGPNNLKRNLVSLEFYSYHYTANPGKKAGVLNHFTYANRPGFKAADGKLYQDSTCRSPFSYGAAHIYIDSVIGIAEFIPLNKVAPHVGAPQSRYTPFIKKMVPKSSDGSYNPNYYGVGAEVCINPESDIYQSLEYLAWHAAKTLREAKKPVDRFIRHIDVTGKWCPAMSIDEKTWEEAKKDLKEIYKVDVTWVPYIPFEDVKARVKFYYDNPKTEPIKSALSPLRKTMSNPTEKPKPQEPVPKPIIPEKLMTGVEIQRFMNKLKVTDAKGQRLAEDGKIGPKSVEAIKKLELKCKVKTDGVWDMTLQVAARKLLEK